MVRSFFILLILTGLTSCAGTGPSKNMQTIVASLAAGNADLDVSRLYKGDKDEFQYMRRQSRMEIYNLPTPAGVEDAFRYAVYYDKSDKQYWVTRFGGIAGVKELYGPAKFPPE